MIAATKSGQSGDSKPGVRLGTQIRGEMAAVYNKRGHGSADLVLHYSWKAKKDVVLMGEREYLHFLLCEFDPQVIYADYSPLLANTRIAGEAFASLVQANVKTAEGSWVWRRLVDSAPDSSADLVADLEEAIGKGPLKQINRLEVCTRDQLTANPMRVRNALRALAWISAARDWPLGNYKTAALKAIMKNRSCTFGEILAMGEGPNRALYGAAVLQLACNGSIKSDLHELPLNGMTLFHRIGE